MGSCVIERILVRKHLSFETCDLELSKGLVVFTGPSGAGKSVFMQALLSLFGHAEVLAEMIECTLDEPLNLEEFGYEREETTVFKCVKSKSVRYFINDQSSSKKGMAQLSKNFLNYLSHKDANEFESSRLLTLLDGIASAQDASHTDKLNDFVECFIRYKNAKERLDALEHEERKVEELKEFARFEIAKIEEVSPSVGEDEELLNFKKKLSKKEKLEQALLGAQPIFDAEAHVQEALSIMDIQSGFFDEAMNELRHLFEKERERLEALEEIDIDAMLDRIEKISSLKKRYGSIEEVLHHLSLRQEELKHYENIAFEKKVLVKEVEAFKYKVDASAQTLSLSRKTTKPLMEKTLNTYLQELYMPTLHLNLEEALLCEQGKDSLHVNLGKVDVKKISSGEYNRLRLAFLATQNAFLLSSGGILILDEIDANLSGKESMSVANVLKNLSSKYQILAISHQPQLSSCAQQHFLVSKNTKQESTVKALSKEERVIELARMVSGEAISEEALSFAQSLLESNHT